MFSIIYRNAWFHATTWIKWFVIWKNHRKTVTSNLVSTNHIKTKLANAPESTTLVVEVSFFSTSSPRKKLLYQSFRVTYSASWNSYTSGFSYVPEKPKNFQTWSWKWNWSEKLICCLDVDLYLATRTLNTRSSTLGLFDVPNTQKVVSEGNYFVRSTRTTNAPLELKVIDINLLLKISKRCSLTIFYKRSYIWYNFENSEFDISNSFSLFI